MVKFTFKRGEKMTGLASIATPHANVDVKLNGKVCGSISAPSHFGHDDWKPKLMVRDLDPDRENPNCNWKWVFFKTAFKTEQECRAWFIRNADQLVAKFDIHCQDD